MREPGQSFGPWPRYQGLLGPARTGRFLNASRIRRASRNCGQAQQEPQSQALCLMFSTKSSSKRDVRPENPPRLGPADLDQRKPTFVLEQLGSEATIFGRLLQVRAGCVPQHVAQCGQGAPGRSASYESRKGYTSTRYARLLKYRIFTWTAAPPLRFAVVGFFPRGSTVPLEP